MIRKVLNKYNLLSLPTKSTLWFTICNLLVKGISFISIPLFTQIMPDDEYGILSLFMSYEQLFLIFATWEIQMGAYQKGLFKYKDNIKLFSISTQALINIITTVFFILVFSLNKIVVKITGMNTTLLVILFICLIVQPSYNCWLVRKRTSYEYKNAVIVTIIYSTLNVVLPYVALIMIDRTANVKFVYTMIATIMVSLIFYISNLNYSKLIKYWQCVKEQWLFLIRFEAPLVFHSLSYLVLSQADRIMIGKLVGNEQAAYYSVAYSIANIIGIVTTSINQSLLPWRYQMLQEGEYKKIKNNTNYLLIFVGMTLLIFVLVIPEIMRFLLKPSYYEAIWCIPPIAGSVYFMFLYTIFVNVESYYEQTKYIMYVSVFCGMLNVLLNYLCINKWGYISCAYTTLVSYIVFAFGHYYFMKKVIRNKFNVNLIVNKKTVLGISFAVIALIFFATLLYPYWIARYVIIVVFILLMIKKREVIIKFLQNMKK